MDKDVTKLNKQHVVLLTSGQPSLNPRLIKEADSLSFSGYKVTVIYQYWNDWGTKLDEGILPLKDWTSIRVGGSPIKQTFTYWFTKSQHKSCMLIARILGFKYGLAELALGRCTSDLYKEAKKHSADLYIAHNLAALPAAIKVAIWKNVKCGFDAEDFHRREVYDNPKMFDVRIKTFIENKYFPLLNYLSTSSPLISQAYRDIYPALKPVSILNVFPKTKLYQISTPNNTNSIKLFWFSQTIGPERGIEEIIIALGKFGEGEFELHLLGDHDVETIVYFNKIAKQNRLSKNIIRYYKPIKAEDIFEFAAKFDVGMATETGVPLNRNICLTNKIFTFIQSGLALIISDTLAQKQFYDDYPSIGILYHKEDISTLYKALKYYLDNKEELKKTKEKCKWLGQNKLNYEIESIKFLNIIKHVLD